MVRTVQPLKHTPKINLWTSQKTITNSLTVCVFLCLSAYGENLVNAKTNLRLTASLRPMSCFNCWMTRPMKYPLLESAMKTSWKWWQRPPKKNTNEVLKQTSSSKLWSTNASYTFNEPFQPFQHVFPQVLVLHMRTPQLRICPTRLSHDLRSLI